MAEHEPRSSAAGLAFVAITILGVIALVVVVILAIPILLVFNWLTVLVGTIAIAVMYVLHRRRQKRDRG